jgi:HEAT repeat protein
MTRLSLFLGSAALAVFLPPPQGPDLSRRMAAAPDGLVKMTYAAREGICGDGRSFIADATQPHGYQMWMTEGNSFSGVTGGDIRSRCAPGPVRLLLVVRDHRVVDVQPFVGPPSPATDRAGTEFGTVSAAEVSRYLLDLATRGTDGTARSAILAATLADSVRIASQLAAIARNKSLGVAAREAALKSVAQAADREGDRESPRVARAVLEDDSDRREVRERAVRVLAETDGGPAYLRGVYTRLDAPELRERIVRVVGESGSKEDLDWVRTIALDKSERTSTRERAVRVLAEASDFRTLRDLYDRLDDPSLRERVVRVMAELGDGDSRRWLREIVERRTEPIAIRDRAIRSLADMGDVAYLRSAYRTVDDDGLRERILRSVAEVGGAETKAWLLAIVRDTKEQSSLRERAVRLLAESGTPTSELVTLYDAVPDNVVRDRLVNIFAERGDRASRDKLRAIASDDPSEDRRQRALRKLAER